MYINKFREMQGFAINSASNTGAVLDMICGAMSRVFQQSKGRAFDKPESSDNMVGTHIHLMLQARRAKGQRSWLADKSFLIRRALITDSHDGRPAKIASMTDTRARKTA